MQTRENRIYRSWRAVKKNHDYRNGEPGTIWMTLAVKWKMSIRELKEIVAEQRGIEVSTHPALDDGWPAEDSYERDQR